MSVLPTPVARHLPPATSFRDVFRADWLQPLAPGDDWYQTLTVNSRDRKMNIIIRDLRRSAERAGEQGFCSMILTGHRGCGKTTELQRLEHELKDIFFPVHLTLNESFREDFDYSLLMLTMSEEIMVRFADAGMPLNPALGEEVALWFAEQTISSQEREALTAEIRAQAEAKAGFSLAGIGLSLLSRLRAQAVGSLERRVEIKQRLQLKPDDLLRRVNSLLAEARAELARQGKPARLLVVHDNLDRLGKDAAVQLLHQSGYVLQQLAADCIFTAPVPAVLAPHMLTSVFRSYYSLPMVTLRDRTDAVVEEGVAALAGLIERRVDIDRLFDSRDSLRRLCLASGGSVRDLMRLLIGAVREADVDDKDRIDGQAVEQAVTSLRIDYEQHLVPERLYYPRLAQIHRTKGSGYAGSEDGGEEAADKDRSSFGAMLLNGTVLEYNGRENWYGVHPVVQESRHFTEALAKYDRTRAA